IERVHPMDALEDHGLRRASGTLQHLGALERTPDLVREHPHSLRLLQPHRPAERLCQHPLGCGPHRFAAVELRILLHLNRCPSRPPRTLPSFAPRSSAPCLDESHSGNWLATTTRSPSPPPCPRVSVLSP